jgi:hypothetical protein
MNTLTRTEEHQTHPRTRTAFRSTELLVGGYTGISVLALAIVLLRNHATVVNSAVWTHGTIVAASALLLFAFAVRAVHDIHRDHPGLVRRIHRARRARGAQTAKTP